MNSNFEADFGLIYLWATLPMVRQGVYREANYSSGWGNIFRSLKMFDNFNYLESEQKNTGHVQKLAINKKSTVFAQNFMKIITS